MRSMKFAVLSNEIGKLSSVKSPKCERSSAARVLLRLPVGAQSQGTKSGAISSESGAR